MEEPLTLWEFLVLVFLIMGVCPQYPAQLSCSVFGLMLFPDFIISFFYLQPDQQVKAWHH